eukprot:jgi/Bigna1/86933/estExt_fgenesh1_pg.C_150100
MISPQSESLLGKELRKGSRRSGEGSVTKGKKEHTAQDNFMAQYNYSFLDLKNQAAELGIDLESGRRTISCGEILCGGTRYYASQVAWCVGFGAIEEDSNASKWWTVFFNLTGASIIGAAIVYFLQMTLENQEAWKHEELSYAMNKQAIAELEGEEVGSPEGTTTVALSDIEQMLRTGTQRAAQSLYAVLPVLLTIAWVGGGVLYGMKYEQWDFIVSLYFAVTALTTAGLQSAAVDPHSDTFTNWFMAFYVLFGVPIFASTLGWIASKFFEIYTRRNIREKVNKRLKKEDLEFASMLLANIKRGNTKFSYGDFLEFMLVRLALIDISTLQDLRCRFHELDKKQRGYITLEDIQAELEFERFDLNGDGVIRMVEFVTICGKMGIGFDNLDRLEIFNRIDLGGKGVINRNAFSTWWHSEGRNLLPESTQERSVAYIGGLQNLGASSSTSRQERSKSTRPDSSNGHQSSRRSDQKSRHIWYRQTTRDF